MPRIGTHVAPSQRTIVQYLPYLLTLMSLSSITLLAGCSAGADAQAVPAPQDAIPVRVATVRHAAARGSNLVSATGTLGGKEEVALAFKIGGVIERIAVDEGNAVRAGQVLAQLRPTEIAAQLSTAEQARQKAARDLARISSLYADSVATLEQLQDARTAADVAANGVRIAQFNADHAVIRAPGDGIVLSRLGEPGQVVDAGRTVLQLRRNGRGLVVRVALPDRDAVRVRMGQQADVTFDALPGRSFAASVTQRAAQATSGSGAFGIELTLRDAATTLPSGLVARVQLQLAPHTTGGAPRVTVPLDALVDADADSAAVFVLGSDGRTVSRRIVFLTDVAEALTSAQVPIVRGLQGGETIVTAGMSRLVHGTVVRVVSSAVLRDIAEAMPQWKAQP